MILHGLLAEKSPIWKPPGVTHIRDWRSMWNATGTVLLCMPQLLMSTNRCCCVMVFGSLFQHPPKRYQLQEMSDVGRLEEPRENELGFVVHVLLTSILLLFYTPSAAWAGVFFFVCWNLHCLILGECPKPGQLTLPITLLFLWAMFLRHVV